MSRSGYSDDCENVELYRTAVRHALMGRRGQAFLRELIAALDALPKKKLIEDDFEREGAVCALGAVARARGMDLRSLNQIYDDAGTVGRRFGIAWSMAAEIMYENDEAVSYHRWNGCYWPTIETPEQRFVRVRRWAERQIIEWEAASDQE